MGSPLHRAFRGLFSRVVIMEIPAHTNLHREYSAPRIPKDIVMADVIEEYYLEHGQIDIVREKRTCETYELDVDTWQIIKAKL